MEVRSEIISSLAQTKIQNFLVYICVRIFPFVIFCRQWWQDALATPQAPQRPGLEWLLKRARIPPILSHYCLFNLPSPYIIESYIFYVLCCLSRRKSYIEVKDGLELMYAA